MHQVIYTGQNWNRRFREYSDKLQSTDLAQVASVLKELLLIGQAKDLSFGEKRLQEQAMALVTGELAQVLTQPEENLRELILACYQPEPIAEAEILNIYVFTFNFAFITETASAYYYSYSFSCLYCPLGFFIISQQTGTYA